MVAMAEMMFLYDDNNITNDATTMQDWALQGIMYVDSSEAWLIYLNVMKTRKC